MIVLGGRQIATPGLETISWLEDRKIPRATDFNDRTKPIACVLLHTVHGKRGALKPGSKSSVRAEAYAKYQAATERDVSWDYTVDTDGTIIASNDPLTRYTWHAGPPVVNSQSIGIEAVQDDDGAQYSDGIAAEVRFVELLCEKLNLPRRTPVDANGAPFQGLLDDQVFRGVYGHRNIWKLKDGHRVTMKGLGDPDDHVFHALLRAGFQGVLIDAHGRPVEPSTPAPPPSWADLSQEITDTSDLVVAPEVFIRSRLAELARLGVTGERAFEATAHTVTESASGRRAIGDNCGGIKLRQDDDAEHRRKFGIGLRWWRYRGHVAAGDAAWVFYRAFEDRSEFWRFALKRYMPQQPMAGERYAAAGAAFWGSDPSRWMVELILAGYRGAVREREMRELIDHGGDVETHPSIVAHRSVVARVRAVAS